MKISVIIPTFERPEELLFCLEGILRQTLPPGEVIIVNDSRKRISLPRDVPNLKLSNTGGQKGQGRAKNLGAKRAEGEILVFLDDDCYSASQWLKELVKPFQNKGIALIAGRIQEKRLKSKKDRLSDIILNLPFYPLYLLTRKKQGGSIYLNGRTDANLESQAQGFCDWGGAGNLAVRKSYFEKVGGFDENLLPGSALEEPDLCWRIKKIQGKIFYNGWARVDHYYSPQRRLDSEKEIYNLRANEVYFGLKNIAFCNPFNFFSFLLYQVWQIFIYSLLALGKKKYWLRVRGKMAGAKLVEKWRHSF